VDDDLAGRGRVRRELALIFGVDEVRGGGDRRVDLGVAPVPEPRPTAAL